MSFFEYELVTSCCFVTISTGENYFSIYGTLFILSLIVKKTTRVLFQRLMPIGYGPRLFCTKLKQLDLQFEVGAIGFAVFKMDKLGIERLGSENYESWSFQLKS